MNELVATKLASWALDRRPAELPAKDLGKAEDCIIDAIACASPGGDSDGARRVHTVAKRTYQEGAAAVWFATERLHPTGAAFANGALVHALNYDPIGATIGHVGVICLAAPLAMAEAAGGKTGGDLITASAVACEITARITEVIARTGRRPSEKFLSGQLLTYFGAAAGAGRILGLDSAGMHNALGLALMQMAGSRQIVQGGDPPAKAIYGAFPNQAGVQAALLAKAGPAADIDIFGKPAGLDPVTSDGEGAVAHDARARVAERIALVVCGWRCVVEMQHAYLPRVLFRHDDPIVAARPQETVGGEDDPR